MPGLSDYAASKEAAEQVATRTLDGDRLTIVRPPAIYGPWDRGTLPFFKAAAGRIAPKLPDRNNRVALIHVEDAAAAIAQLAAHGGHAGRYTLADRNPQGYSWPEILAALARAIGSKPRYVEVPEWLLKAAALAAPLAQVVSTGPVTLTPGKLRELLHPDWSVTPAELPPESLWQPIYDLEQGFHSTVTWLRFVGWLPH
jgi:nucleoside-diphosphate-sugar epimerase